MPSKIDYKEVKRVVESKGFTLLTPTYTGSLQKLDILCPKHGIQKVTLKWLRKGTGCFECGQEVKGSRLRHTIEFVRKEVEAAGYKLLSEEYERGEDLLSMECPKHGPFSCPYGFIKGGHGCRACGYERVGDKKRTPFEEITELVSKTPYTLISKTRTSHKEKVTLRCNAHGQFKISLDRLKEEQGCRKCGVVKSSTSRILSHKTFAERVSKLGYEMVSHYTTSHEPVTVRCPAHGEFTTKAYSLSNGHGCPSCAMVGVSSPEKEVLEFVRAFYPATEGNTKKIIAPLELDVYVPEINLAVEYCGLYWHSEKGLLRGRPDQSSKDAKNYHANKQKMCNENGIRLLTIFEDEWLERQEQVKGYLRSVLNKNEIKLFARKTELKEVAKKEAKIFLESHHVQGSPTFEVAFGLYFDSELMAVITGNPHHRQGHGTVFVLNRLAFKGNVSIAGGASKLLKRLLQYAKDKGFAKLLSWSDNRFSEGRVYEALGFTLEDEHGPDYSYVKGQTRISKQSCQKKSLIKKGAKGTMDNTEQELAAALGLTRIWDCGKKAWSMDLR